MNTMYRKRMQLSVVTVAALAIVAVGAVMLLAAGGSQAQASNATLDSAGSGEPNAPQQQTDPEECSSTPAHVISSGHYALFDVYWDDEEELLVNNPCPPEVTYVPEQPATLTDPATPARFDRSASDINIATTIFHVSDTHKKTLTDEHEQEFPFVDGLDETGGVEVWVLPDCSHEKIASDNHTISDNELCLGYSAAQLNSDDWTDLDFEFESIREPGFDPSDRGNVFVFIPAEGDEQDFVPPVLMWDTKNPDTNELAIDGGESKHRAWLFTEPGRYEFAVHVKAHPDRDNTSIQYIIDEGLKTVTSEVRTYTFHVGPLTGLEVTMGADDDSNPVTTPNPAVGDVVTYTVNAINHGPDAATDAIVQVHLPEELIYEGNASQTVTDVNGTVAWHVGALAAGSANAQTLTFDASVAADAGGLKLTAEAEIRDPAQTDLDDNEVDNSATVSVTTAGTTQNRQPMVVVSRQVHEMAAGQTLVGDPIRVWDADWDTLSYSLHGPGADAFEVDGQGQIKVTDRLDYETKWSYDLRLDVSDSKAADGTADTVVDASARVRIAVQDVEHDDATLTLSTESGEPGEHAEWDLTVVTTDLPSDANVEQYLYYVKGPGDTEWTRHDSDSNQITLGAEANAGDTVHFFARITYTSDGLLYGLTSAEVSVTVPSS